MGLAGEEISLGFKPFKMTRSPLPRDVRSVVFEAKKVLAGLVYDAAALEGNPMSFPEVQTLLDGITVGGHRLEDERMVLNLQRAWRTLFDLVLNGRFRLDAGTFRLFNGLVAFEESVSWGEFRRGQVRIQGTNRIPPPPEALERIFEDGVAYIQGLPNPHERGINFFLFAALHQFFYDGNKRTGRLMMNGELLAHGHGVINVPAAKRLEFNRRMIGFYDTLDAGPMGEFLLACRDEG